MVKNLMQPAQKRVSRSFSSTPAVMILAFGFLLTGLATYFATLKVEAESRAQVEMQTRRVASAINVRMETYIDALRHTRSLFVSRQDIDRQTFAKFVEALDLHEQYPGIQGIGYSKRISPAGLANHVQTLRNEGFPNYRVWPEDRRDIYFSIVYLEPFDRRNQKAFGFDMFTEANRRQAMEMARDTGLPSVSQKVILVQETDENRQNGFLIYVPHYKPNLPIATVEQRREALLGFVYSPFRSSDLFMAVHDEQNRSGEKLTFSIYQGDPAVESEPIFIPPSEKADALASTSFRDVPIQVANRTWIARIRTGDNRPEGWVPLSVAIFGTLSTLLVFYFARRATRYGVQTATTETRLQLIADSLPSLIAYVDRKGSFRFANRAFSAWYRDEEITDRPVVEVLENGFDQEARKNTEAALNGQRVLFESQRRHPDLGLRTLQEEFIPDIRPDGSVAGIITVSSDITETRATETRLREEQKISELVSEVGLSLTSQLDLEKLVQTATDAATQLINAQFGAFFYTVVSNQGESYTLYTISGVPREAFSKFPMPRKTKIFAPTFDGTHVVRIDDVTKHPDFGKNAPHFGMPKGHLPVKSYLATPVISKSGAVLGGLFFGHAEAGVFTERAEKLVAGIAAQAAVAIDNAKLYRDLQNVNRVKDEFLATVSHELRTPLNVILGHSEILMMEAQDLGPLASSLEAIQRNAKAQNQIISDLLDISAVITGKISFSPTRMKTGDIVKAAVESVRFAAESKGINLHFVNDSPECTISADPTRIQQVTWNLLTNAIKFTPRGGSVEVMTKTIDSRCLILVRDTGIGIEKQFLPYVFDRFRQEDSSMARRFGGLGLGLAIVKNLVELHGGTIEVQSEGKELGATFTVSLPIAPAVTPAVDPKEFDAPSGSKSDSARPIEPPSAFEESLKGMKLLVVDDEPDAREVLKQILSRHGAAVTTAATAADALKSLQQLKVDLVVSDIGLPEEDGLSFMRKLRALESSAGGFEFTPAVALTAYAREQDRNRALSAGYQAHLAKPVDSQTLIQAILKALS